MARVMAERMCAQIDGDFVVFLIGMRVNKPWKVWRWWHTGSSIREHPFQC